MGTTTIRCANCGTTRKTWEIWSHINQGTYPDMVCCLASGLMLGTNVWVS